MSGCHNPKDNNINCIHGTPVKLPCKNCFYETDMDIASFAFAIRVRVDEIEQRLNNLINMPNIAWAKYNKTPHKCPVCEGDGKIKLASAQILLSDPPQFPTKMCISCEGKGIVWG